MAIDYYQKAIDDDPTDAFPECNLGVLHWEKKDYSLSETHFRKAIKKNPNLAEPENGLGVTFDGIQKFELADKHYQRSIRKNPFYALPELNLARNYTARGKFLLAKMHWLRFLHLDQDLTGAKDLSTIISFFYTHSKSPFVVAYALKKYLYAGEQVQEQYENILRECELLDEYISWIKFNKTDSPAAKLAFQFLRVITTFYQDLPFKTYQICNEELDGKDSDVNLFGNYYMLLAAAAFNVPAASYKILLDNALDDAQALLDAAGSEEIDRTEMYYAGQICWNQYLILTQNGETENAIGFASRSAQHFARVETEDFLPPFYMHVLALDALGKEAEKVSLIGKIISLETTSPNGPEYLNGFETYTLDIDDADFLKPFQRYAYFQEIREAIEMVTGAAVSIPEFHEAWKLPRLEQIKPEVKKHKLALIRESLSKAYVEKVGSIYNEEKANDLITKKLKGINGYITSKIDDYQMKSLLLRDVADDEPSSFETELATFIYDWKVDPKFVHMGEIRNGRDVFDKTIAYFTFNDSIKPLTAFYLTYYAFFVEQRHRPKHLFNIFKDSSYEGVSDFGKDLLEDAGKALLMTTIDIAFQQLVPIKFFVGFVAKVILSNFALFMEQNEVKLSAFDDYQAFKKLLDEKTLELLEQYQPANETDQQAYAVVSGWYNYSRA